MSHLQMDDLVRATSTILRCTQCSYVLRTSDNQLRCFHPDVPYKGSEILDVFTIPKWCPYPKVEESSVVGDKIESPTYE